MQRWGCGTSGSPFKVSFGFKSALTVQVSRELFTSVLMSLQS